MSEEIRPEDEVEAHGPVTGEGPGFEEPAAAAAAAAASDDEPDFEAHGPLGMGPAASSPVGESPVGEAPVGE